MPSGKDQSGHTTKATTREIEEDALAHNQSSVYRGKDGRPHEKSDPGGIQDANEEMAKEVGSTNAGQPPVPANRPGGLRGPSD